MRLNLKSLLVALAIVLLCYALIDGLRTGSEWGIIMATCSMLALYISVRLSRKLARLNEEGEENNA
jgi:hypothetical protein